MTESTTYSYCCNRFEVAVEEGYIIKAEDYDETEWYFPELGHLYYCPFCGKDIKGVGFGEYNEDVK